MSITAEADTALLSEAEAQLMPQTPRQPAGARVLMKDDAAETIGSYPQMRSGQTLRMDGADVFLRAHMTEHAALSLCYSASDHMSYLKQEVGQHFGVSKDLLHCRLVSLTHTQVHDDWTMEQTGMKLKGQRHGVVAVCVLQREQPRVQRDSDEAHVQSDPETVQVRVRLQAVPSKVLPLILLQNERVLLLGDFIAAVFNVQLRQVNPHRRWDGDHLTLSCQGVKWSGDSRVREYRVPPNAEVLVSFVEQKPLQEPTDIDAVVDEKEEKMENKETEEADRTVAETEGKEAEGKEVEVKAETDKPPYSCLNLSLTSQPPEEDEDRYDRYRDEEEDEDGEGRQGEDEDEEDEEEEDMERDDHDEAIAYQTSSTHAWLPTDFHVASNGRVQALSYINNLHPLDDSAPLRRHRGRRAEECAAVRGAADGPAAPRCCTACRLVAGTRSSTGPRWTRERRSSRGGRRSRRRRRRRKRRRQPQAQLQTMRRRTTLSRKRRSLLSTRRRRRWMWTPQRQRMRRTRRTRRRCGTRTSGGRSATG